MLAFNVSEDQLDAYCDGNADHKVTADKVIAICPRDGTVALALTLGLTAPVTPACQQRRS